MNTLRSLVEAGQGLRSRIGAFLGDWAARGEVLDLSMPSGGPAVIGSLPVAEQAGTHPDRNTALLDVYADQLDWNRRPW